ncbi:MAG: hypothetical protein IJT18_04925 [Oscillospiraceae bacterium]|nr:hypothetical protein [Oscillospiraceae bacterium]
MKLEELDPRLTVKGKLVDRGYVFYDCEQPPFRVYGLLREGDHYCRMPRDVAQSVNEGVLSHHVDTAGGRVRFVTDSDFIAIRAEMNGIRLFSHMPLTASAGFDLYATCEAYTDRYCGTFVPPKEVEDFYENEVHTGDRFEKTVTINFPMYSGVKRVLIGVQEGSTLKPAPDYRYEQPVLFYGSSITQGGCASTPGSAYFSILSRRLDCNIRNLGFSGSAKGEQTMIDYLCAQDMGVFVLDYDHNAPSPEHLRDTHEKLFLAVRAAHPDVPVIMMPRPKLYFITEKTRSRVDIVRQTYENALAAGDKNVYFIDNVQLTELVGYAGTVDGTHPTDSGHLSMANAVEGALKKALGA